MKMNEYLSHLGSMLNHVWQNLPEIAAAFTAGAVIFCNSTASSSSVFMAIGQN
jgi:hypothetical protein